MTRASWLSFAALACSAALLAACGGGDGGGRTTVVDTLAGDAAAPPCASCVPGVVTGTAAIGRPLAGARVSVHDDSGLLASTTTDGEGRFRLELATGGDVPRRALLLELVASVGGEPLVLHTLQSAEEAQAGRRALHLTPLTTLIAADVLGAAPQSLIARGQVDWRRITRRALADAHARVKALVQPVLDGAAVPATVDLRSTAFAADGTGLDAALDVIHVQPDQGGWRVGWKYGAAQARFFDPASPSAGVLPTAPAPVLELQHRHQEATSGITGLLDTLGGLFAHGVPTAATLAPHLAPDFLHAGLDAAGYTRLVLRRQDAPDEGGHSLVGARWHDVTVLQQVDAGQALVRFRTQLRGALGTRTDTMWMVKDGTGWRLRGNGGHAAIHLRQAVVLGPAAATAQTLRELQGAACVPDARALLSGQWCSTPGGTAGLPAGGVLDFGDPAEVSFGALGLYRTDGPAMAQRQATGEHSRLMGRPSLASRRYLVFEVDAREIAPQVARVRVRGGALPAGGIDLLPPSYTVNGPAFAHWTLAIDKDTGWAGLPWGWCEATVDPADCQVAWARMHSGTSLVFDLLDIDGTVIASPSAALPPEPADRDTAPEHTGFARFDLAATPQSQPLVARLMADAGQAMLIDWPWRRPSGALALRAELALQRSDLVGSGGTEILRRRALLDPAAEGGRLAWTLPARSGWGARWLGARLTATDALGVQRIHFVAPSNPY